MSEEPIDVIGMARVSGKLEQTSKRLTELGVEIRQAKAQGNNMVLKELRTRTGGVFLEHINAEIEMIELGSSRKVASELRNELSSTIRNYTNADIRSLEELNRWFIEKLLPILDKTSKIRQCISSTLQCMKATSSRF